MSLLVVVGGQYGSEGKGKIAAFLSREENIDICVRCGGPNSGHSFINDEGKTITLRQLPTGFVNGRTRLLLPAGAFIDPLILKSEIETLSISPSRIGIDPKSFVIEERDRQTESFLRLRERLSSTLSGVGAAVSRRVLRGEDAKLAMDITGQYPWLAEMIADVSAEINTAVDRGKKVLIEGTQGFGLSLYHSEHYPHCTGRDTTASGFLSEVGLSPRSVTDIVVVFRTFPIRVAGAQAGPLREEITWQQIRAESGYPYEIQEHTSVTGKVRRVGRFDWDLPDKAVMINRPTRVALNGLDYLDFANFQRSKWSDMSYEAKRFVRRLEEIVKVPVTMLGTGPSLNDVVLRESETASPRLSSAVSG